MALQTLSNDHYVLLAFHYTSESNISALRSILTSRPDAFSPQLVLRILLTFLPESVDPATYVSLVEDVASGRYAEQSDNSLPDTSPVEELSEAKAHIRVKHQHLTPLDHPSCPPFEDSLIKFMIHRAHRLDKAGLLPVVPTLVDPFLERSDFLRTWFISNILPLLRFEYEYYPADPTTFSLDNCENSSAEQSMSIWLSHGREEDQIFANSSHGRRESWQKRGNKIARDMRGLVGPWMYGYNQRKRRRLDSRSRRPSFISQETRQLTVNESNDLKDHHDWVHAFSWLVHTAIDRLPVTAEAFDAWNGPPDVDFGGFHDGPYLQTDVQHALELGYIQAAFASVYAAKSDAPETHLSAHTVAKRISGLMKLEKPFPSLQTAGRLPDIGGKIPAVNDLPTSMLEPARLLQSGHPLTTPNAETFTLLQLFVYSADVLAQLGHRMSVADVVRLRIQSDADNQLSVLKKLLHSISAGTGKNDQQWDDTRQRLLWLWGWNLPTRDVSNACGEGVFGKVSRRVVEEEFLKVLLSAACYPLISTVYLGSSETALTSSQVEDIVVSTALQFYDNASNGNRSRGGMRKAHDIISGLKPYFPQSTTFGEVEALLAATHSLSFYSLRLQHGVPFQPVNIRVSKDPVILIEKVLTQNSRSYAHLDDLITIGVNLVAASPLGHRAEVNGSRQPGQEELRKEKRQTERRVIGMAIEAALKEDDFETAYSYVVNRLDTSAASGNANSISFQDQDDISWRAALAAGRHTSTSTLMSASTSLSTPPVLRRLEQRMELLSQALLLAPPPALPEILSAWRKCEEEMTSLLARENEADVSFNDRADQRLPGTFINSTAPIQSRREVGRGVNEEAPMGLFDLARGAAGAFSRRAFPTQHPTGRAAAPSAPARSPSIGSNDMTSSGELEQSGRVRKRDMIADAATGALASGLGWVLGRSAIDNKRLYTNSQQVQSRLSMNQNKGAHSDETRV